MPKTPDGVRTAAAYLAAARTSIERAMALLDTSGAPCQCCSSFRRDNLTDHHTHKDLDAMTGKLARMAAALQVTPRERPYAES